MTENKHEENNVEPFIPGAFWWARQIVLTLLACLFLLFGVDVMIAAYRLDDPFIFVMSFFSASFIILISITILIGLVYRIWLYSGKSR